MTGDLCLWRKSCLFSDNSFIIERIYANTMLNWPAKRFITILVKITNGYAGISCIVSINMKSIRQEFGTYFHKAGVYMMFTEGGVAGSCTLKSLSYS